MINCIDCGNALDWQPSEQSLKDWDGHPAHLGYVCMACEKVGVETGTLLHPEMLGNLFTGDGEPVVFEQMEVEH